MFRCMSVVLVLLILLSGPNIAGAREPLPTIDDFLQAGVRESDLGPIVRSLLMAHIGESRSYSEVRLLSSQVRQEWLPEIANVRFVLLPLGDEVGVRDSCIGGYWIGNLSRDGSKIFASVESGSRCGSSGVGYVLSRRGTSWRVRAGGSWCGAKATCDCD